ncbi:endolytic transglycosylase MltG [bacterium]|nr:endolytic transglycosylase MltG [bacterium]
MQKIIFNRRSIAIFFFIIIIATTFVVHTFIPYNSKGSWPKTVFINNGDSLSVISKKLRQTGLIRSKTFFKWFSIFLGNSSSYKRGEYQISNKVSAYEMAKILEEGRTVLVSVTLPEGLQMKEIFSILNNGGFKNSGNYSEITSNLQFLDTLQLPVKINTLEGFLFPDTYKFAKDSSEKTIIETMVKTFLQKLPQNYANMAKQVNLSYYQAIILASIIEKETSVSSERTVIASVFHNRLKREMRLQTDPTVIYGISNFNGNLTRKQLRTKTPYNTYIIHGLPPTPIANPGLASLMAAVNPAQTDFLYFVAKGDGTHEFSMNYKEHNMAVSKYQRQRKKEYRSF